MTIKIKNDELEFKNILLPKKENNKKITKKM